MIVLCNNKSSVDFKDVTLENKSTSVSDISGSKCLYTRVNVDVLTKRIYQINSVFSVGIPKLLAPKSDLGVLTHEEVISLSHILGPYQDANVEDNDLTIRTNVISAEWQTQRDNINNMEAFIPMNLIIANDRILIIVLGLLEASLKRLEVVSVMYKIEIGNLVKSIEQLAESKVTEGYAKANQTFQGALAGAVTTGFTAVSSMAACLKKIKTDASVKDIQETLNMVNKNVNKFVREVKSLPLVSSVKSAVSATPSGTTVPTQVYAAAERSLIPASSSAMLHNSTVPANAPVAGTIPIRSAPAIPVTQDQHTPENLDGRMQCSMNVRTKKIKTAIIKLEANVEELLKKTKEKYTSSWLDHDLIKSGGNSCENMIGNINKNIFKLENTTDLKKYNQIESDIHQSFNEISENIAKTVTKWRSEKIKVLKNNRASFDGQSIRETNNLQIINSVALPLSQLISASANLKMQEQTSSAEKGTIISDGAKEIAKKIGEITEKQHQDTSNMLKELLELHSRLVSMLNSSMSALIPARGA